MTLLWPKHYQTVERNRHSLPGPGRFCASLPRSTGHRKEVEFQ